MTVLHFLVSVIYILVSCRAKADDTFCIVSQFDQVKDATKNCTNIVIKNLFVPAGETLVLDLLDGTNVTFSGNTTFGHVEWSGPLSEIYGTGITITGEPGHIINGQGELYWDGLGSWGTMKPKFFRIKATNAVFKDLHIYHSPMHTIGISNSKNVIFSNIFIDCAAGDISVAPYGHEGHNTDGFGIGSSQNIIIKDSVVYNQDDCVALNSGSNILVSNLLCHGSHGLSLSVGFSNTSITDNTLTDVIIEDSVIFDAMDGIHIKTHVDAGTGIIRNITYRNIFMAGSYQNGIAIEQNYTNTNNPGHGALPRNNIPIQDLTFINVKGTVLNSSRPYYIVCAEDGCFNWEWQDVYVYGTHTSACVNFHPKGINCVDSKV